MRLQLIVLDDLTSREAVEVLQACGVGSVQLVSTATLDSPRADGVAAPPRRKPRKGNPAEPIEAVDSPAIGLFDEDWRPIPLTVKASRVSTTGRGKKDDRSAEIERRLRAGETVPAIAKAVGLTESAIYLRRKKLGLTPEAKPKAKGRAKGKVLRLRCQNCTRLGQDPKQCEHCFERR